MQKIIIAAVAKNGIIGNKGEMPWHSREEFKHFKSTTMGSPIIMGRKTFESIGKPLPGRLNIIISRNSNLEYGFDNLKLFTSLDDAVAFCDAEKNEKIYICGGRQIYEQSISDADEMVLSVMKIEPEGDTYFPDYNITEWEETDKKDFEEFTVYWYKRKNN